jgi:Zn-dependent protease with chaperone function
MDKRISLRWAGYGNLQAVPGVAQLALFAWMVVVAGAFQNVRAAGQARESASSAAMGQQSTAGTSSGKEAAKQGTDQFRLSRERYEKAVAYSRAGYTLHFVSAAWGIVVLVVLLKMGVVGELRDFAEAKSRKRFGQALVFVPGLSLLLAVLHLPIGMYWHRLSLKYEQSVQGWGSWFWDWTKGELISIVLGLIVVLILFAVIRRKPKSWWLYFWFASIPLVIFVIFIAPWVLDPMFNKFEPLSEKHADLVESIGKLTERAGMPIPPERMFLMEASAKTNQINAYVTGIGASKRVVVWDNTIKKMAPDEVLFVVGHEMGHYVLGHVVKGTAFALGGILVALFLAYRALHWILGLWGEKWGVRGQEDWAALAVLLLIGSVLGFLGDPIGNGFSRMLEHAADVYGLEVIHGIVPDAQETAAHAFQVMGELDLADPDPPRIITVWLYSHPPLADRLRFAHDYDPWGKGEAPKYVK